MASRVAPDVDNLEEGREELCELKPVKLEGDAQVGASFVDPILAVRPELIFDRITPPNRKQFEDAYGLSNEGPNP